VRFNPCKLRVRSHRRRIDDRDPLGFAVLTALGRILELFVVEKQLFPSGENKVGTAVDAGQYLILKFH